MATLSPASVRQMAYNAGFRGQALDIIVAIAGAESSYNPTAENWNPPSGGRPGSWDLGLVQINASAWPGFFQRFSWSNPQQELNYAYSTISRQGSDFSAWSTYNSGAYRQYMSATQGSSGGLPSPGDVAGGVGNVVGGLVPGSGLVPGLAGGAVGGAVGNAAGGIAQGFQDAAANLLKWVLPHAILLGGAGLCLVLLLHELTRGMPLPVPA